MNTNQVKATEESLQRDIDLSHQERPTMNAYLNELINVLETTAQVGDKFDLALGAWVEVVTRTPDLVRIIIQKGDDKPHTWVKHLQTAQ